MSHVSRVTGHTVTWLDNFMDVVILAQYEAVWWQQEIHREELSAGYAVPRAFGAKVGHRYVVSLAGGTEQDLV